MFSEFLKRWLAHSQKSVTQNEPVVWSSASDIEAQVKQIVADHLSKNLELVSNETNLVEEGDSVGNVEMVMLCEETFGIEIPDEDAELFSTVGHLTAYIQQRLLGKQ